MYLILGCTAVGKGAVAFELARRIGGQILSIDSMKVYRRMDIGTAKPDPARRRAIKHHLVDVIEPADAFSLGKYMELADEAIGNLNNEKRPIIAVGGTALYIRALLEGIFQGPAADLRIREELKKEAARYGLSTLHDRLKKLDAQAAQRIHPNDEKRIFRALEVYEITGKPISSFQQQFRRGNYRYDWKIIGLHREKEDINHRINMRVHRMIEMGLLEEVKSLLAEPRGLAKQAAQAVGYAEIIAHLKGEYSFAKAVEKIKINTRRLAKHQRTWFRGFNDVRWLEMAAYDSPAEVAGDIIMNET